MEFSVSNNDLLDGLRVVTRALSARPAKQILEGVLVEAMDDCLTLVCSDGLLTIETTMSASVSENGRVVLPGRLFTELCAKLPNGSVTIRVNGNHMATVQCMKSRSNLSGMDPVEYPDMPEIGRGYTLELPQNKLREMISRVAFSTAVDESRQILTGCLLEIAADEVRLVALDGFRMALQRVRQPYDMPEGKELLRSVIPGRVMSELSKVLKDEESPCELLIARSHMQAVFGSTRMSAVLLAGDYIDYRRLLPGSFKSTAVIDRTQVTQAIDRASLMAREGKNNLIRMSFRDGTLAISSNAETGDVHEELEAVLDGDPIEIAFNVKYITDVIRNSPDDSLRMAFTSAVSPCVITPVEGDDYLYLILPVRVFN